MHGGAVGGAPGQRRVTTVPRNVPCPGAARREWKEPKKREGKGKKAARAARAIIYNTRSFTCI